MRRGNGAEREHAGALLLGGPGVGSVAVGVRGDTDVPDGVRGAGGGVLNEFDMEQSFAAWLGALERINFQSRYGPRSCFFERYSSLG